MARKTPKIRLGLLMDSPAAPAWVLRCIERIIEMECVEISLVVLPHADSIPPRASLASRLIRNRRHLAWHGLRRVENRLITTSPDACELRPTETPLAGVPRLAIRPRREGPCDYIEGDDLKRIARHEIDVFVRFGFGILRGEILNLAPCGVWSFHHGDNSQYRGGPPGLWEIVHKDPVTGAILQRLDSRLDAGLVLDRIYCATDFTSVRRTQNGLFWAALSMLPRALARLEKLGPEEFFARAKRKHPPLETLGAIYREPGNIQTVKMLTGQLGRIARRKCTNLLTRQQWAVMFSLTPGQFDQFSPEGFQMLLPPKDRFWADPHIVRRDGVYHVFIEEFDRRAGRGHIAWLTIDEAGRCSRPEPIIRQPYHMSYPFVFTFAGQLYMLPETFENRTIELYRCVEFPRKWQLHRTIMSGLQALDPTVVEHNGRWWMFVNIVENPGAAYNDELFLFWADTPTSCRWRSHPCNPIVSDVRRARPGGAIFRQSGKLYRPAQDCSGEYGQALRIQEIQTLSETQYAESQVAKLQPTWSAKIKCLHTFSQAGQLTAIDVRLDRRKFL
jgi:hypothetical protein